MTERPVLNRSLDPAVFRDYYWLKEELTEFCRNEGLRIGGNKIEITDRIFRFLDTGEKLSVGKRSRKDVIGVITDDTEIGPDFMYSEKRRMFFEENIGKSFTFNVTFQRWLKSNPGKTYRDAVKEYRRIVDERKTVKTTIDRQFEYNTYIREFFADNPGKTLAEAIICWKQKKSLKGHNRYERNDLTALTERN